MCDQNIAVSIRTLNQMSSIIPNRMEKLKLASLSAGIVAGFTTDCFYDESMSLAKGYDATVSDRVNGLSRVLKNYIVLNKSWFDTGARTISDARNIFITGRKHPLTTLGNIFSMVTLIEYNQNDMEKGLQINAARSTLVKYGLSLDVPFYRLLTCTREKGLLVTLTGFREDIIKKAKRIDSHGQRLDILDETQISTVVSVVAGLIIAYTEPLPSTPVDFNDYYAVTAYPFAMSLTNQLVEKMQIDTTVLFGAYRSGLETRYELAFEPTTSVRGLMEVLINNNVLATDMAEAITNSNKGELLDYIVGMVKGVYDVRKEALERDVLHNLDYLPIDDNPISDMVNRPESHDEIQERMQAMLVSNEAAVIEIEKLLNSRELTRYRTISNEAMSGSQKLGILFMVLGGALMAWAVYATFFKNAASSTKNVQAFHEQINKDMAQLDSDMANINNKRTNPLSKEKADSLQEKANKAGYTGNVNNLANAATSANHVTDINKSDIAYKHRGNTISVFYDYSQFKVGLEFEKYEKFVDLMNSDFLDAILNSDELKKCNNADDFKRILDKVLTTMENGAKAYALKFPAVYNSPTITSGQLSNYVKNNVHDAKLIKTMEEVEATCTQAYVGLDHLDVEAFIKELDAELIKNNIDEATRKLMGNHFKAAVKRILDMFKEFAKAYLLLIGNVRVWDHAVVTHMKLTRLVLKELSFDDKMLNPVQAIQL